MKYEDYQQKLLDPRWQKKRLQVLERDHFTCQGCGAKHRTLHVHHYCYTTPNPWDESEENLVTLCEECHNTIHNYQHGLFMKQDGGLSFVEHSRSENKEHDFAIIWRWAIREKKKLCSVKFKSYEKRWNETPEDTAKELHGSSIIFILGHFFTWEERIEIADILQVIEPSKKQMKEIIEVEVVLNSIEP